MKRFRLQMNIGKAKYVVNFHDGVKRHNDGSDFFDIRIFTNKCKRDGFVRGLLKSGYVSDGFSHAG